MICLELRNDLRRGCRFSLWSVKHGPGFASLLAACGRRGSHDCSTHISRVSLRRLCPCCCRIGFEGPARPSPHEPSLCELELSYSFRLPVLFRKPLPVSLWISLFLCLYCFAVPVRCAHLLWQPRQLLRISVFLFRLPVRFGF